MDPRETKEKLQQLQALASDIAHAIAADIETAGEVGGSDMVAPPRAKMCDSGFYCGKYNCSPPFSCSDFGCTSRFTFGLVLKAAAVEGG